jgi:hypothetical protein
MVRCSSVMQKSQVQPRAAATMIFVRFFKPFSSLSQERERDRQTDDITDDIILLFFFPLGFSFLVLFICFYLLSINFVSGKPSSSRSSLSVIHGPPTECNTQGVL